MKSTQQRSTLELGKILSNYFRLTPDKYARQHFQEHLSDSSNSFDPQVSWDWLGQRVQQDSTPTKNLDGSDNDTNPINFNWSDFGPELEYAIALEMTTIEDLGELLEVVPLHSLLLPT